MFIDGEAGTTGLHLREQLDRHPGFSVLSIEAEQRKNSARRAELLAAADIAVLCLPDPAAVEAVALCAGTQTRILDASTAHRVADGWCYGLPELGAEHRARLGSAQFVSNPGCYPQGYVLAVRPLLDANWLATSSALTVHAVSGYSGGGRQLIERIEGLPQAEQAGWRVRPYGLNLQHKHLPEMRVYSGLTETPLFAPSVGAYYKGMLVSTAFPSGTLQRGVSVADVIELLTEHYADEAFIRVLDLETAAPDGFLDATACNDTNRLELIVSGSDAQMLITARYDNLGKGASGAALQNLNRMCGLDETTGLAL